MLIGIGIAPDVSVIVHHWQNLPLDALAENPLLPFTELRSQPPLWNGLLAVASKVCGAELTCVGAELHGVLILFTATAAAALYLALRRLDVRRSTAAAGGAVLALSPSTIFYENYPFYPHLTMMLATVGLVGFAGLGRDRSLGGYAIAVGSLSALALTVTLFHPAFVGFVAAISLMTVRPSRRPVALFVGLLLSSLAFAPSIKNAAEMGIFSNGTWLGLNLAQVAPGLSMDDRRICSFQTLVSTAAPEMGRNEGEVLNQKLVAAISHFHCLPRAEEAILARPMDYLTSLGQRIVQSHFALPYQYGFAPLNFGQLPQLAPIAETLASALRPGDLARAAPALSAAVLAFLYYPAVFLAGLVVAVRSRNSPAGPFFALSLLVILWLTLVSHAANGSEQERMRYTIEPIYGALAVVVFDRMVRKWGKRV